MLVVEIVPSIVNGTGKGIFKFNGGTLRTNQSSGTFMTGTVTTGTGTLGSSTAYVLAFGAIMETNGNVLDKAVVGTR